MIHRSAARRAGAALLLLAGSCGLSAQARAAPPPAQPAAAAAAACAAAASAAAVRACQYQGVDRHPGVRFTLASGVVSRAETRDMRYTTPSGVHVGDTLGRARQAYGKPLSVAPHPYFDNGHTLTVYSPDRRFALVMESDDSAAASSRCVAAVGPTLAGWRVAHD